MLCQWHSPKRVLEIGTFTGYSTICMASGIPQDGKIYSVDINPEHRQIQEKYLEASGFRNKVTLLQGNALEVIPTIDEHFDFVFMDADKENYPAYYELIKSKLNPNALIIADNVLWSSKVLDPKENDKETTGIRAFNKLVQEDSSSENLFLPFNDGLMLVRYTG